MSGPNYSHRPQNMAHNNIEGAIARKSDDQPQMQCPRCRQWIGDHDGFGVLAHGKCGYCSHPSVTNGICGLCGELKGGKPSQIQLIKGDTVTYCNGIYKVIDVTGPNFAKIDFSGQPKWVSRVALKFVQRTSLYNKFRAR